MPLNPPARVKRPRIDLNNISVFCRLYRFEPLFLGRVVLPFTGRKNVCDWADNGHMRSPARSFILIASLLCALSWHQAAAQQTVTVGSVDANRDSRSRWEVFADDCGAFVSDGAHVLSAPARFDGGDWLLAGAAVTGIGASMVFLDESVRDLMLRNQDVPFSGYLAVGDYYGRIATPAILSGAMYLGGLLSGDHYLRETGLMVAEATAFAGIITTVTKMVSGRSRPFLDEGAYRYQGFQYRDERLSFPSGHCTLAFAISTVLAERFDHPVATIILYLLAGTTAMQRMYADRHWLSDVLTGSIIGYAVGRAVVDRNTARAEGRQPAGLGLDGGEPNGFRLALRFGL